MDDTDSSIKEGRESLQGNDHAKIPSLKSLIFGIYKKLQFFLEEEIQSSQQLFLEKKTPAKHDVFCYLRSVTASSVL